MHSLNILTPKEGYFTPKHFRHETVNTYDGIIDLHENKNPVYLWLDHKST